MIRTNRDNLRAALNQAREEDGVLTRSAHLTDEANVSAWRDAEFGKMQKTSVAKVDIDVAGGGLQQNVHADRRCLRIFGVFEHRALQRNIVGDVVGPGKSPC